MIFQKEISDEELAIIGHVVSDPVAWVTNALHEVGAKAVDLKIEKYRAAYEGAKTSEGKEYKSRAQRDAEDEAVRIAELASRN